MYILLLVTLLLSCAVGVAYGADYTKTIDAAPFIENDRAFDTTRPIAETFGIYVNWNPDLQQVSLRRGATQVIMTVGAYEMRVSESAGERVLSLDVAPQLRQNRVFLPVRLWAEHFGLQVQWHESDGSVTVSEGVKTLRLMPGEDVIALTGGHFLKPYTEDSSLRFFYPEPATVNMKWEGNVEALMEVDGVDYVITAINSGAGRSDPIVYTDEEIGALVQKNTEENDTIAQELPLPLFDVRAFRISGVVSGSPQVGVVFLKDGFLCGLTIERRLLVSQVDAPPSTTQEADTEDTVALELDESELSVQVDPTPMPISEGQLQANLVVMNGLLDEIMFSFQVL